MAFYERRSRTECKFGGRSNFRLILLPCEPIRERRRLSQQSPRLGVPCSLPSTCRPWS
ncbi:hypothetical protein CKAH01_07863 [Colletotrichum kahawae]|uniref:Uncharacterized protein n=1 Tax=Colletotrichum kahawae TaxID=34407 RepID=A0AAD9Y6H4_COLKA|nr:hypothetical protein CKAH01_07863 [Colletotrichum kahawae]